MCRVGVKQRVGRVLSFFLQSLELGLPQPLTRRRVCPLPFGSGGRGTLAGERGVGRVPIPTRGHRLLYSLYISTLCICIMHMFVYTVCLHVIPQRYLQSCTVSHGSTAVLKKVSSWIFGMLTSVLTACDG
jgi:hypothetical protein